MKVKKIESGQGREAGGHHLGWDVSREWNIIQLEIDEVSSRQE